MKRVFLDTNFLMDLFGREADPDSGINQYEQTAVEVLSKGDQKNLQFFVSFLSVANFAYLLRKSEKTLLYSQLLTIRELFTILPNTENNIYNVLSETPNDLEDAIQYDTAIAGSCDCIITRNAKDFPFSKIPIYSPQEFLTAIP